MKPERIRIPRGKPQRGRWLVPGIVALLMLGAATSLGLGLALEAWFPAGGG